MDLTGQVALITGGSRGLGRAFAQALLSRGVRVAITGRSQAELQDAAAQLSANSGHVLPIQADVCDPGATTQVVATVEREFGPISLLINNAGQFRVFGTVDEVDSTAWWQDLEVNVRGPFLYMHSVLPSMRVRQQGRIINLASGAGLEAMPTLSAYGVSKTALIRLTETVAQETAADSIYVFAIHPGTVKTPMNAYVHDSPEVAQSAPHVQAWFRELYATGGDTPIEQAVSLVVRLAAGKGDTLSDCFLSVEDDLDSLIQLRRNGAPQGYRTLRLTD